jgi:hypothetical protein
MKEEGVTKLWVQQQLSGHAAGADIAYRNATPADILAAARNLEGAEEWTFPDDLMDAFVNRGRYLVVPIADTEGGEK